MQISLNRGQHHPKVTPATGREKEHHKHQFDCAVGWGQTSWCDCRPHPPMNVTQGTRQGDHPAVQCYYSSLSPTGLMLDGTSRGRKIYHLYGTSAFTEYTVMHEIAVGKIDATVPMDKGCIISSEVPKGFGAMFNTAKVTLSPTCTIFGLRGIGSAIVIHARVDINEGKFPWERPLGVTDCLNP
ncbi:PREDICTED: alcohol dehydrogenase 6-like [Odobenus rosmarus divergens]|uniref:Alcohol dehydrogenase 6-like n=1 Tax=Odobenus rosmarus divergens TaxID=9708 RepID=A0A9B0LEK0_ODORO